MAKIKFSELPTLLKKLFPDNQEVKDLEIEFPEAQKHVAAPAQTVAPTTDPAIGELKTLVETQKVEIEKLMGVLGEIKTRSDKQDEVLASKAKTEQATKIQAVIDKAIQEGKIPAKNEAVIASYKSLLEANYDATVQTIGVLPAIAQQQSQGGGGQHQQQQQKGAGAQAKKSGDSILNTIMETGNFVDAQ